MFGLFFDLAKTLQCLLCSQRKRESNIPKKRGRRASLFLSAWRFIVSRSQCVTGNARSHGRLLVVIGAAIEGAGTDRNYCL